MALVIHRAGALGQSKVRTLSLRLFLLLSGGVVGTVMLTGATLGYFVGRAHSEPQPEAAHDDTRSRYLMDRVGALSARLYRLESEAAMMVKRLNLSSVPESGKGKTRNAPDERSDATEQAPKTAAGGVWLPPRNESEEISSASLMDTLGSIEATMAEVQDALGILDNVATRRAISSMAYPSRAPVASLEVGSRFGNRIDPIKGGRAFHNGLDFPAEYGSPIRASAGGRVITAGFHGEMGNMVEIEHEGGRVTRYGHASRLLVKAGDFVVPGQVIAKVGSTGRSTGPHVHFEIVERGRHVDPERYLGRMRVSG